MRKMGFLGLTLSPLPFALISVGALLLALSFPAQAQQAEKIPRIGYLHFRAALVPPMKPSCKACTISAGSRARI